MSIPTGYSLDNDGFYYKNDGSGPYAIASNGEVHFLGGLQIASSLVGFSFGPNGFVYKSDGSGPYVTDGTNVYTLAL